jgi:hypothetical protein
MKKYKNINEEIERIKSLFTEERLYGNLINEKKIIKEQLIQILKKLLGSTNKLKNITKTKDVLGRVKNIDGLTDDVLKDLGIVLKDGDIPKEQIDFLIKYTKKVKEGNVIDIFKKTGDIHLFELFPNGVKTDFILDYFNSLTDATLKTENIKKFKSYLDENNIPIDSLPDKLQNLVKNLPSVKIEKSLVKIEKALNDGSSVKIEIDISTPEGKQLLKELGITNPKLYVINKSTDKVFEDVMSIGVSSTNKSTFLKNLRKYYPKRVINATAGLADLTIPLVGLRHFIKNILNIGDYFKNFLKSFSTSVSSFTFAGVVYPFIYDKFTGGKGNWSVGVLKMSNSDLGKWLGYGIKEQLTEEVCESLIYLSRNNKTKLSCGYIGEEVKKIIQNVISIDTPEKKEKICAEINDAGDKTYTELFKEKIEENKEEVLSLLKSKITPLISNNQLIIDLLNKELFSEDSKLTSIILNVLNSNEEFQDSVELIYTELQIECDKDKVKEIKEDEGGYHTFDLND